MVVFDVSCGFALMYIYLVRYASVSILTTLAPSPSPYEASSTVKSTADIRFYPTTEYHDNIHTSIASPSELKKRI